MAAIDYLPHYTYDDYKQWEGRWELIYGVPYAMSPAPMIRHQQVSNKIAWQLQELLDDCEECMALLPVDWKISEDTIVQPDNLVYCGEFTNQAYITKAPRIIFEVLSPSTAIKDANLKFELYEREGVRYYVIVDPKDNVAHIYENVEGRFVKRADATKESFTFEFECPIEFDFSKVW